MIDTLQGSCPFALRASVLACGLLFVGNASAGEGDVASLVLGQSFIRDSNLFRLSDGADTQTLLGTSDRSDTISRTEAILKVDLPVSRQRFLVDVGLAHLRYDRFSFLSHDAYTSSGKWLWELGNRFRGDVILEHNKTLTGFTDFRRPVRNLGTYSRGSASGYYWFHPEWGVGGAVGHVRSNNSSQVLVDADNRNDIVEVGLQHKRPNGNELGLRVRRTDSTYPNRQDVNGRLVDNSFVQDEVLVVGSWKVTAASTLSGYVGRSERSYDDVPERDFSTPTAKLSYDWIIDPRLTLNLSARRELSSVDDVNPTSLITRALGAAVIWAATPKINVEGRLERAKRDFRADVGVALLGNAQREDKVRTATIAALYRALRGLQFSLSYTDERRDSNFADNQYKANVILAGAQITF